MDLIDLQASALTEAELKIWKWGFLHCLDLFAIWNDGERFIGSQETNVKEIRTQLEQELGVIINGPE